MDRDELVDALVADAIAHMVQPERCEAVIRALASVAKGLPVDATFPEVEYEVGPDGQRRLARPMEQKLEQVRDIVTRAEERARSYPGVTGSTYYAAYLEILALVTTKP